jgi:hypothetical protein
MCSEVRRTALVIAAEDSRGTHEAPRHRRPLRSTGRFPEDFMFERTKQLAGALLLQNARAKGALTGDIHTHEDISAHIGIWRVGLRIAI